MPDPRAARDVAVIVPVFNRLGLLRETVASLRSQTLQASEFILVDDRSDSETREYLDSLPDVDERFRIVRKPDAIPRGSQSSRNIGLDSSNARAVVFLDSDDLLTPLCLEERYGSLKENRGADIVVGRQAILEKERASTVWVNVPSDRPDLDRFLMLAGPLDVPWVNGGVIIRASALLDSGSRWMTEFMWDDVAFHFQCVVSGLRSVWSDFALPPDSFYRRHTGDRFGRALFTPEGMRSTVSMIAWMRDRLMQSAILTEARLTLLRRSFYHTCLLRAIDLGEFELARSLLRDAAERELVDSILARDMGRYILGREATRMSARATYYWNRWADKRLLAPVLSRESSTYVAVKATSAETFE